MHLTNLFPILFQKFHSSFHTETGAVDGQIVVSGISPFSIRIIVVISFSLLICGADHFLCLRMGNMLACHNAGDTRIHITKHKQADQSVILGKNSLSAASDKDERLAAFRDIADHLKLHFCHCFLNGRAVAANGTVHENTGRFFIIFRQHLLCDALFLGQILNDLGIIESDAQLLSQHFSDNMSAASEFSSDGNNRIRLFPSPSM